MSRGISDRTTIDGETSSTIDFVLGLFRMALQAQLDMPIPRVWKRREH
jgi:hypothetical protein